MTGFILRKAKKIDNKYYLVRDVPIFSEHVKYTKDGHVDIIDENDLRSIVNRMRRFGPASVIVGHTSSDNKYDEQEVVGLAFGFRIHDGDDGKKYLMCDIITTNPDMLNKYPRRSIELWDDYTVNPIALLGSSTPKLDLPATIIKYSRKPAMDTKELVQEVLAAIQNTAEWKFLSQLLQEWESLQEAGEALADNVQNVGVEQAEKGKPEDETKVDVKTPFERDEGDVREEVKDNEEHQDAEQDVELIEKLLNEYLEESDADKEAKDKELEEKNDERVSDKEVVNEQEPVKHSSHVAKVAQKFSSPLPKKDSDTKIQYRSFVGQKEDDEIRHLREELQRLRKEREELLAVYRREKRHTILNTLRTEGYDINIDEELKYVDKLDDSAFVEHVNRIRKYYRRAPTAPINPKFVRPTAVNLTQEMRDRAIEHATIKGISFEDAVQELYGIS